MDLMYETKSLGSAAMRLFFAHFEVDIFRYLFSGTPSNLIHKYLS